MYNQDQIEGTKNNRRKFLKSMGIAVGASTVNSASAVAQSAEKTQNRSTGWTTARSHPTRTGRVNVDGPTANASTDWKMDLEGGLLSKEPIISDNTLYLAITTDNDSDDTKGFVAAYDVETGSRKWQQSRLPSPKTPTIKDQTLYVATNVAETTQPDNSGIYALDIETGEIRWRRTDLLRWSSPVVVNRRIFTSNERGAYALDRSTGDTIWKANGIGKQADSSDGALSYANGTIFFSDGTAVNAADGSVKWRVTDDKGTFGNHAISQGRVYSLREEYIDGDDNAIIVEARSPKDGGLLWKHRVSEKRTFDRRFAVADEYVLFFGSEDGNIVTALNARTGNRLWSQKLSGEFFSNLTVANSTIYVGGRYIPSKNPKGAQAIIYALDLATGNQKWSYLLDDSDLETSPMTPPAAGTPVISNGRLYAATYPAGSMLNYQYTEFANFFAIK